MNKRVFNLLHCQAFQPIRSSFSMQFHKIRKTYMSSLAPMSLDQFNQQVLACGTTGSELFVWDMVKGIPLAQLEGHTDVIDWLAWSPNGNRLASVARDGTIQIWDVSLFASTH